MKTNKRQTADIFGVTQQAIDKWHSEGLPVEVKGGKGRESQYDTARVHTWLLERYKKSNLSDLDIERTRLIKAQADRAELEAAEKLGELIPVDMVKALWSKVFAACRGEILAIPSYVVTQCPQTDRAAVEIIRDVCRRVLTDMSQMDHAEIIKGTEESA